MNRTGRTIGIVVVTCMGVAALFFWAAVARKRHLPASGQSVTSLSAAHGSFARDPRTTAPPRFLPLERQMPRALASDLARFNDDQLRAELESLGLSYPGVEVGGISCPALPCRAQASSTDRERLAGFVDAVHRRFKGFVNTDLASAPTPSGPPSSPPASPSAPAGPRRPVDRPCTARQRFCQTCWHDRRPPSAIQEDRRPLTRRADASASPQGERRAELHHLSITSPQRGEVDAVCGGG